MEAVIFIGIQASGKSTFYQRTFADTHIRINLDMLRTRHRELILFEACLKIKQPFVVDNTNPTAEDRNRYIPMAKSAGFRIIGYFFESEINAALRRNSQRKGKKNIPSSGVMGTHARLEPPSYSEGFDNIYTVIINAKNGFTVKEWNKMKASPNLPKCKT